MLILSRRMSINKSKSIISGGRGGVHILLSVRRGCYIRERNIIEILYFYHIFCITEKKELCKQNGKMDAMMLTRDLQPNIKWNCYIFFSFLLWLVPAFFFDLLFCPQGTNLHDFPFQRSAKVYDEKSMLFLLQKKSKMKEQGLYMTTG